MSASPDAVEEALPEPPDAYSISPPYPDEEEPPALPAADPQDSALQADATAEKATSVRSEHRAALFADAEPECSADSEQAVGAYQAPMSQVSG